MNSPQHLTDVDQDGFMVNQERWSKDLAMIIAKDENIENLSAEQWEIIEMLRDYYIEHHTPPPTREVCEEIDREKLCIPNSFPNMLIAWKVAGLPNPGEEAKAYMANYAGDDVNV